MDTTTLPYRQIHLDFHTFSEIPDIGRSFNKSRWREMLRAARVNSVTCFAKCHHGWSYHPTKVGKMHPNLDFDLLRAQYDTLKEVGIRVPIYLSAGIDNLASSEHPEWREVGHDGRYLGWTVSPLQPGFHKMDFHSPYLDYLCVQIEEVAELFPDCDGIFLDIVSQGQSCSRWALEDMRQAGLDPTREEDRLASARRALDRYHARTSEAAHKYNPAFSVIQNSGHIRRGARGDLRHGDHLEIESLPTGGWGYDHFPETAAYLAPMGIDYLGMTGKFHTTWGEFGGLKHPNALRYECAAMLAFGARCSIGDQLHPSGELDESTYQVIGQAYGEVEAREPWCRDAKLQAQIGVLSSESEHPQTVKKNAPDTGAARILLEGHFLFHFIDRQSDFLAYDVILLPDDIRLDKEMADKCRNYLQSGGRLFLTGESGLSMDRAGFALDVRAEWFGPSPFEVDYLAPARDVCPAYSQTPFISYLGSQRIVVRGGQSLGKIADPYFNRTWDHFCGHQHAPPQAVSEYDCAVESGAVTYLAHKVFSAYRAYGQVNLKLYVMACLRRLLGARLMIETDLPSTARVTLHRQEQERRWVLHLLHAIPVSRGGPLSLHGGNSQTQGRSIEVIEDFSPLHDIHISIKLPAEIDTVLLQPEGTPLPFERTADRIEFRVPKLVCHEMVVLQER